MLTVQWLLSAELFMTIDIHFIHCVMWIICFQLLAMHFAMLLKYNLNVAVSMKQQLNMLMPAPATKKQILQVMQLYQWSYSGLHLTHTVYVCCHLFYMYDVLVVFSYYAICVVTFVVVLGMITVITSNLSKAHVTCDSSGSATLAISVDLQQ